jgi:hypothetical protein
VRVLRRMEARALKREEEVACVHGRESSCRALIGLTGRRTGQRKNDNRRRRFCASAPERGRHGRGRDFKARRGRSSRGGHVD